MFSFNFQHPECSIEAEVRNTAKKKSFESHEVQIRAITFSSEAFNCHFGGARTVLATLCTVGFNMMSLPSMQ
uniref:Uncharacterized protein n=1 Tax=Kalanchoe fedtschenkoi TaxID=63787 RepID=A0A7N0VLZ2_KALFE